MKKWLDFFHSLVIPFVGGFALTLAKLMADQKLLSFDQANDIALDMVLLAIGALGVYSIRGGTATVDAGVGDGLLAAILLYLRYRRHHLKAIKGVTVQAVGALAGIGHLILGAGAIIWTMNAF